MNAGVKHDSLQWRIAWGVAGLQIALQLGWMSYRAYQPALLETFGFGSLVFAFTMLPGLLGLVIEPLAGALSDRLWDHRRERMPIITIAVLVAGLLFITILGLAGGSLLRGTLLLPVLLVAWQIAVQSAASPSLALLEEAAPLKAIPRVAALTVLAHGLIEALDSPLSKAALQAGPSLTFSLSAVVLLLGLVLIRAAVPLAASRSSQPKSMTALTLRPVVALLLISVAAGLANELAKILIPSPLPGALEGSTLFYLGVALGAPWSGIIVARMGAKQALPVTLVSSVGLSALMLLLPPALCPLGLAVQGVAWGGVTTTLTSLALVWLTLAHSGLAAGLLLAGTALANSLVHPLENSSPQVLAVTIAMIFCAVSALVLFRLTSKSQL